LHVCHVWERFWPIEIGGLERYILWLTNYLGKKEDIEFSLITGRTKFLLITKNIKKYEDTGFLKVYRLGPNPVDILKGVCIHTIGGTPRIIDRIRFTTLCQEAANLNVAKSADVFHIHGIWQDLEYVKLGIYLSRKYQKPLVVTLHGGYVGNPQYGGMPLKWQAIRRILEIDATAITTYSQEVLNTLRRMGLGKKSYLITNFLDKLYYKNLKTTTSHETTVIYVGRLEPVQKPDLILRAFKKVTAKLPNAKLIIVGYGRMYDPLKQLVKELGIENSVCMAGKQTDVRSYLWKSDIFVANNFGYIATLEAWAAGLAVVVPNFGVLKEIVNHGENGLLFDPNNEDDLAEKLVDAIEKIELRQRIACNGAYTVQDYDIRTVAPKMLELYRSISKN
jgi:glycosyltransferase involved in cell wall biosynthesis